MTTASYTPASSPDIALDEYLQKLVRQGASPAAAVASLARECREGYIELRPDIPAGTAILFEPDGHFYVETAAGPVSARDYICHKRSRFERVDYLHSLDQRARLGGAVPAPPGAQAVPEVPPGEQQPAAEPAVAEGPAPAGKAKPANKRGPKESDVWELMFAHLEALVKERGRRFETCKEAAVEGLAFLKQLAKQRREKGEAGRVFTLQTIAEKIGNSEKRPDLVIG